MQSKQEYEKTLELSRMSEATQGSIFTGSYSELDIIADLCCEEFKVPFQLMEGKSRIRLIADCRAVFFFFACNYTSEFFPLKSIGEFCGGRHHTTVIAGRDKVYNLLETDQEFTDICSNILFKLSETRLWQK